MKGSRCHWLNQQRIPPRRGDSPSIRPLGRTLWGRVCCQRAPQDGSVSPPPSLSSPQSDGPYYVHRCPGPASSPGSVTGEPCGLGADACPPRSGPPRGGTPRGCTAPPTALPPVPRRGRPGGGARPGLGLLPGTGGRNVETTRLVCKAHSCKAADAVLLIPWKLTQAAVTPGSSPPSPRGRSGEAGRATPPFPREMTLQTRGFA